MITLIRQTITDAAKKVGIQNILDITKDSILIPKPYLTIQFLGEIFDRSGYILAGSNEADFIKTVLTKYKGRLSVSCNIVADDELKLTTIADNFLNTLPRQLADKDNNIVTVQAVSGEWQLVGGKQVGLDKLEVMVKRSRLIKIDFIYHVTEERRLHYLKKFDINIKEIK